MGTRSSTGPSPDQSLLAYTGATSLLTSPVLPLGFEG